MEVFEKLAMLIVEEFVLTFDEFVERAIAEDQEAQLEPALLVFAAGSGRY